MYLVNIWMGVEQTASVSERFPDFAEAKAFVRRYSWEEYPEIRIGIWGPRGRVPVPPRPARIYPEPVFGE